jgi:hypothetical protein
MGNLGEELADRNEHAGWTCITCGSSWVRYEHLRTNDCDESCEDPCTIRCCNEEECGGVSEGVINTNTRAIGVTAVVRWKDMPEGFSEYISLGTYLEDEEKDTFGIDDLTIFYYAEGLKEINKLMTDSTNDWIIEKVMEIHYA